jgi:hypothetical protein
LQIPPPRQAIGHRDEATTLHASIYLSPTHLLSYSTNFLTKEHYKHLIQPSTTNELSSTTTHNTRRTYISFPNSVVGTGADPGFTPRAHQQALATSPFGNICEADVVSPEAAKRRVAGHRYL